jgi:hypothetical protein
MSESFERFNLETMSGVFPGVRTRVYQRVRLMPLEAPLTTDLTTEAAPRQPTRWARILWYEEPPSCVVELEARHGIEKEEVPEGRPIPLLRIPNPDLKRFLLQLQEALAATGWRLMTCGSCMHWRPLHARTEDGLAVGRCIWRKSAEQNAYASASVIQLSAQSMLALDCIHWRPAANPQMDSAAPSLQNETLQSGTIAPMRRHAEQESDERWTWLGRLRRWLRRSSQLADQPSGRPWEERMVERSGVGAGTEPCFACQGKIANLGALTVETPEGDKQTFSVWRCRTCYTYYLNDWIDRWERTESLETEERFYRLTPAEALEILAVIDNVVDAEHPARRHERSAQRNWMVAFIAEHPTLSHQIRQGR